MTPNGSAATILVVEDNVDNQIIMKAWLEHAGYEVLMASDGVKSLSVAQAMLPDIILMDVALPRLDGWDAAERLKAHPSTKSIPIIALTALAPPDDRLRAKAVNIDGYLTKPVALSRVLEEVERLLRA
jgi:two-component system cell cycle response regulator DivK